MPETIVVPLDGSPGAEAALGPAAALARRSGARLVLVSSRLGGPGDPDEYLGRLQAGLDVPSAETVVVRDRRAPGAIDLVAEQNPDPLVCMRTSGRSGLRAVVFGSVAQEVMRRARVPVLLVGPSVAPNWELPTDVVACVDDRPASRSMVPLAAEYASALDCRLWTVTVIESAGRREVDPARVAAFEDACVRMVQELSASVEPVEARWRVLNGDPADELVAAAATFPAAMMVMATRGHVGLGPTTVGSVTTDVVRRAPGPVLARAFYGYD